MVRLIEQTLKPLILDLGFVGQYGGLAIPVNIRDEGESGIVSRIFPVSCYLSASDCFETGKYNDLVPDDRYASVAYFEQRGGSTVSTDGPKRREWLFTEEMRFVCWLNYARLGLDDCRGSERFAIAALSKFFGVNDVSVDGLEGRLNIRRARIVPKSHQEVFGRYSYGDKQWAFFFPYDFFAVDFTAELTIGGGCVQDVDLGTPVDCTVTYGEGISNIYTVRIYRQAFSNSQTAALVWTQNNGTLPTNTAAQVFVFQEGQKLEETVQYTISASTITIDAATHYAGANYEVIAFINE